MFIYRQNRVRVGTGHKVSIHLLNQQLSSSLGLSFANLPNIQVIGDFGPQGPMEPIDEQEDALYEDEDITDMETYDNKRRRSTQSAWEMSHPRTATASSSSNLERIVNVPFTPNLPGVVPEDENEREMLKTGNRRRNSAPIYC